MKKLLTLLLISGAVLAQSQKRILVFSKTVSFRHASIKEGKEFFLNLGKQKGFAVDTTENSANFNEENLKKYNAVVWLSTTGDVLNPNQQADFERYIQAGGGYVGIHAASDTEYDWAWYNDLMGGYFASHPGRPNVQNGKMITLDKTHPSTAHLPDTFERKDEFYDFKSFKKELVKSLIRVDEGSYTEGKMGDFHPLAWYHEYDGGKSFYTNYGHTPETFVEPLMVEHIWGGLKWAMAENLDYSKARSQRPPEENRFLRTTITSNLDEPTELAVMPDGRVIFTERKGTVRVWNPATKKMKVVAKMPVYTKFEYGLMGVGIDPNFKSNKWIYMFYTPNEKREDTKDQFLSRFEYDIENDTILFNTEKVVLRFPVKRNECCHTGGSIDWDKQGNLFLSSGDDTNPFASDGYAPIDYREGREGWDALSTSSNTNDLRGKVLRITPQADGTYTIPEGNLFPVGTENGSDRRTRPEIYVMGCRNPYRISVDKHTGYLYWGDIGPDAGKTNPDRGPEGIVEFNQAKKAGYFGWPIFTGNNKAYNHYDFATKKSGEKFDASKPINDSPHNTGLTELPPATPAWIWYGYGDSKEFPWLGKGGANPMAGEVYYVADYQGKDKFPSYFDGKFFAYEWMRDWIYLLSMDKSGKLIGAERFMPNEKFAHPMDMAFAPDGTLYVLDYGMNWFTQNQDATLSRIEYNAGNRKPVAVASADKQVGALPLTVNFSSLGTKDYDGDAVKYQWSFGKGMPSSTLPNPKFTFKKAGTYEVALTVTDALGNQSSQSLNIKAGNAEPELDIVLNGNRSFFFDDSQLDYEVKVKDKEDGTLGNGVDSSDVIVSINYLEGFDKTMIEQGHKMNLGFAAGKRLIESSDCKSCHSTNQKSIGPAYLEVAKKYRRTNQNVALLTEKIIQGGGGVWGEQAMAAHPQVSQNDARDMVEYILSLVDTRRASKPVKATQSLTAHKGKKEGAYIVQASYTDKGNTLKKTVVSSNTSSKTLSLRSPKIKASTFDEGKDAAKFNVEQLGGDVAIATADGGYLMFRSLDLTGVKTLTVSAFSQSGMTAGGKLEIRTGSPTGTILGEGEIKNGNINPVKIALANVSGQQNLYLVFRNANTDGKPLYALTDVVFDTK